VARRIQQESRITGNFVWSGYYVGVQGGYGWGEASFPQPNVSLPPDEYDIEGAVGGLYYGRHWQSGNCVFGLDGSISLADIQGNYDIYFDTTIEGFSATRLRIGYAVDNFHVFAAGGFSIARVTGTSNGFLLVGEPDEDSNWAKGFTVGAGV
jgi:outer membrane immunogenic protein